MTCLIKSKPYETFIHYVDWGRGNKQVPHVLKYVIKQAIWCCLVKKCNIYIYIYIIIYHIEDKDVSCEVRLINLKEITQRGG